MFHQKSNKIEPEPIHKTQSLGQNKRPGSIIVVPPEQDTLKIKGDSNYLTKFFAR